MLHFIHNIDTVTLLLPNVSLWCLIYYLSGRNEVAVPRLRQLVAGLSMVRPGFIPRLILVGFVVDKVALGELKYLEENVT